MSDNLSCKEAGSGWVLCGFEPREENEDCYTIVLHCVDDGIGGYLWVGQNDESGVTCLDYLCFDGIGDQIVENVLKLVADQMPSFKMTKGGRPKCRMTFISVNLKKHKTIRAFV